MSIVAANIFVKSGEVILVLEFSKYNHKVGFCYVDDIIGFWSHSDEKVEVEFNQSLLFLLASFEGRLSQTCHEVS